jgi:hypothetical protein
MRWLLRWLGDALVSPSRAVLLRRAWAAFGLILMAATWRLWTPQHVFPQVPFFQWTAALPAGCQWVGAGAMLLGLAGALVGQRQGTLAAVALWLFAAAATGMMLLDQERLQPWAYQFLIVAVVMALADARAACALLRLFTISFYFYSALTKFDASFLHTLGQQFLSALAGVFGASLDGWSDFWRLAAALVFPMGEASVALGLCFARSRRWALAGAVLLHVLLLVILGPWGLHHKPGVLVWNLYFIVQDVLLFGTPAFLKMVQPAGDKQPSPAGKVSWLAQAITAAAICLPLLGSTTWFDIWPSWGLYASCAERVTLLIHRRGMEQLPDALQTFAETPEDPDDPWLTLRLDRWSLDALGAPIYPQNRFQLGVVEAVIVRYQLGHRARVVRFDLAERWTGIRSHQVLAGLPQVIAAGDEYFFNTRPRQRGFHVPDEPVR